MTYLVHLLPAWSRNLTHKVAKHPKVYVADTGSAAHVLGKDPSSLARPTDPMRGQLLETFVVNEVLKQASWLAEDVRLYHLRDRDGVEVDLVIEGSDGKVVAAEVKASSTVGPGDPRQLAWLRDKVPDDFVVGVVFHADEPPGEVETDTSSMQMPADPVGGRPIRRGCRPFDPVGSRSAQLVAVAAAHQLVTRSVAARWSPRRPRGRRRRRGSVGDRRRPG